MPYIKKVDRDRLHDSGEIAKNPGELNYIITCICRDYVELHGGRYQQINDVLGALEGAKLEFYRRLVTEYEETKINENGDVYFND